MTVAEWSTIASLATALGTLILAVATLLGRRSSNLMAKVAQQQLLIQLRPVLSPSRREDPTLKVNLRRLDVGSAPPAAVRSARAASGRISRFLALPVEPAHSDASG